MPLSTRPIIERRGADQAVSLAFGGAGCSTHTPSRERPGAVSDQLRATLDAAGYPLQTTTARSPRDRALIEVYPHPALLRLMSADYRVPYKVSKRADYWPTISSAERIERLLAQWAAILRRLQVEIDGVGLKVPAADAPARVLKSFEDALDALVCAWVATRYLAGRTEALGDASGAIWNPLPVAAGPQSTRAA